jgi:hypothetical protein
MALRIVILNKTINEYSTRGKGEFSNITEHSNPLHTFIDDCLLN